MSGSPKAEHDPMDAPADRFCDIVMEGGVTSGIIYTSAVVELAAHYRFRNIGGSSIGALAAALTAAAEYRRRHGHRDGFDRLAGVPEELAAREKGKTRLERMFVPQPGTRRLFDIFLATLNRSRPVFTILHGVRAALCAYWLSTLIALVLAFGMLAGPALAAPQCWSWPVPWACILLVPGWSVAAVLTFFVAVAAGLAGGIAWDVARHVVRNDFGLCRGWDAHAKNDSPDLAAFLHGAIQRTAGRDPLADEDEPLTFRDLWTAPGSATQVFGLVSRGPARSINLEVYASNLSHGRPYRFPLNADEDMGRLFFRRDEMERFFPKRVVQYMLSVSKPYEPRTGSDPPAGEVEDGYFELPYEDLPVVVAARLAMSFPVLISAVPLHAVDFGRQAMKRCWISDGGLCSNFPIHLFDSFLPMWPTFGISLHAREKGSHRRVWLPEFHTSGRGDTWDHGAEESGARFPAFLASIWKTTWRWNDMTMMRMPGVRDRVVRIYLERDEGGVNIRMSPSKIQMLAENYGKPAARRFIARFRSPRSRGWQEHRWVRINSTLISLRDRILNFRKAVDMDRHTLLLLRQLVDARRAPPLTHRSDRDAAWPSEEPIDEAQFEELWELVQALLRLESAFEEAGNNSPYRAVPRPSLRSRHPT